MRPKSLVSFDFTGGADQSRGTRHSKPGSMVTMQNVRQLKAGEYRKRRGFTEVTPSHTTGDTTTYVGGAHSDLGFGTTPMLRDNDGQMYAWPQSSASMTYMGRVPRAVPDYQFAKLTPFHGNANGYTKPIALACGTSTFTVAYIKSPAGGTDVLSWTIITGDGVDLSRVTSSYGITGTSAATRAENITACYEPNNNLALVFVTVGLQIDLYRIPLNGGAVVSGAYRTVAVTAGAGTKTVTSLDCQRLSSTGDIVVAAAARADAAAFTERLDVSILDTATWAAKAAPAPYTQQVTALTDSNVNMCSVFVSTGANGKVYVGWLRSTNGAAGLFLVRLLQFTLSTLALDSDTLLLTDTIGAAGGFACGAVCGYLRDDGLRQMFWQAYAGLAVWYPAALNWQLSIQSRSWDGATSLDTGTALSQWIASKPCQIGTEWWMATGFEDGETRNLQRSLYLRRLLNATPSASVSYERAFGQIASSALQGNASAAWHHNQSPADLASTGGYNGGITQFGFAAPPLTIHTSGKKAVVGALVQGGAANDPEVTAILFDTDAQYSPPATFGDSCVWPGGVPALNGASDLVQELVPMVFPERVFNVAAGTVTVQACYVLVDSSGRKYRSSPGPTAVATLGGNVSVPSCGVTLTNDNATSTPFIRPAIYVELYAKLTAGSALLQLQQTKASDPFTGYVSFALAGAVAAGEALYTEGGALSNSPAPPCRTVSLWRNRFVLSGTDEPGDIWPSQEIEQGFGPRFNEVLVTEWNDGSGPIYGSAIVDWNYLALFRRDAIGVISGAGPDGAGRGGYVSQTLTTRKGLSAGRAVCSGPAGAYFQNFADYKFCVVSPGLQVVDIGQGVDDFASIATCAVHVERDRSVVFGFTDGFFALDYAHPLPEQPAGQWSSWNGAGLTGALINAMVVTPGTTGTLVVARADTTQKISYQDALWTDNGSQILQKLKTSRLAPFGGLQTEGMIDTVQFFCTSPAGTMRLSAAFDGGADEQHSYSGALADVMIRPAGGLRCKEAEVTIEETTSAGEGPVFSGLAMVIKPAGRLQNLNNANRVA